MMTLALLLASLVDAETRTLPTRVAPGTYSIASGGPNMRAAWFTVASDSVTITYYRSKVVGGSP